MKYIIAFVLAMVVGLSAAQAPQWPTINRPANEVQSGTNRTQAWQYSGNYFGHAASAIAWGAESPNWAYAWATTYLRWPGTDNGVPRTIWFRTGYDDEHRLYINGALVTSGDCCYYAYGYYTAKPGEIVRLDFYTNNKGGGPWVFEVRWDPAGNNTYPYLSSDTGSIALQSTADGGGSYWYSSDITQAQTTLMNSARTRTGGVALGNRTDLEQKIGTSGSIVTIEQTGNYNLIQGLGGGNAIIDGQSNTLNIRQGDTLGRNLIELGVYGNTNTVTVNQARNTGTGLRDGSESGGHYAGLGINGNNNTVTIRQGNEGASNSGHLSLMYIKGDTNNMSLTQANNNDKRAFISVDGSNNNSILSQTGLGNHYIDLMLSGNGHTANITQTGNATHRATINLTNAGGSSVLNLTQQGSTGQQYSIVQQCANLQGCSVTVTQGTGP